MALPTTVLTMTAIGTELGNASRNLRVLCTDSNINPWARYKPGYLEGDGTADDFIIYQEPRGGAYTDPRGYNPDSKSSLEGYRMGDFRGYNHTAETPYGAFPPSTVEFGSSTGTSFGISVTFYAKEIEWAADGVYRATANWATMTHVHILDASDDSIEGTGAIPAIGGNVTLNVDGVAMTQGVPVTKTYHIAFGIDSTHWSIKLGDNYGAGGIGDITVLRLVAPTVSGAIFVDTSFGGGANPPYTSAVTVGSNTNRISGSNQAIWTYSTADAWRCYYSGGSDYYRRIRADWWIKGFNEDPDIEYQVFSSTDFYSNGADNTISLASMIDTPPHTTWEDGDDMILVLRVLTIIL